MTEVVNLKYGTYDVYIGRGSKWGNPYHIGKLSRSEVIAKYREWIITKPELLADLIELKDKRLGCYCAPQECHGDVLVELMRERGII